MRRQVLLAIWDMAVARYQRVVAGKSVETGRLAVEYLN